MPTLSLSIDSGTTQSVLKKSRPLADDGRRRSDGGTVSKFDSLRPTLCRLNYGFRNAVGFTDSVRLKLGTFAPCMYCRYVATNIVIRRNAT